MPDWPRILVVGPVFSQGYGQGTYLSHLFTGCPPERLGVLTRDPYPPDWSRFLRLYRLGEEELRYARWLAWANPHPPSGSETAATAMVELERKKVSRPVRVARSILHRVPWALFGTSEMLTSPRVSRRLTEWAKAWNPEIIYGRYSKITTAALLLRLRDALGIPLAIHAMDDWAENQYLRGLLSRCLRTVWHRVDRELVARADVAIGICEEMSHAYQQRYNRPWTWLDMPVDQSVWEPYARRDWKANGTFRIRYGGRVGWSILDSIVAVARAVDRLRRGGEDVALDVRAFTPEVLAPRLEGLRGVTLQSPEPFQSLPVLQAAADVLLICYDFGEKSFRTARYSMPGKTAECLASGTPCLVYGPAGLPVVEYARRERWGLVVDDPSPEALDQAILRLKSDADLRESLGCRALELVRLRHDASVVAEEFRRQLAETVTVARSRRV
jgi:glycosyltransferase involved in cell wall biosynthesis